MELRLYDTLTRQKKPFQPLDPANVRMYVCGPTVYDFAHIGNARPVIVFDVLFRLLQYMAKQGVWDGGRGETQVTYVRNITDVDDKINARAARDFPNLPLNDAIRRVTEKTADQFHADVKALGCLPPTFEPRATEFVLPRADGKADMVTLIKELIARGHAYEAGGEVLFDTQSMPDYGQLSGRKLEDQQAGARVAVEAHKKNPADFVLWKQSTDDEPGWDSPWGRGRPGWHIECSAMSAAYLGEVFDIHGGGLDLIFPHHENEIAQSRCAHGTHTMANVWMHNGFLQVEGEKMSKSLGNFFTINELLATDKFGGKSWDGATLRLAMLKTHYRQPIDWTVNALDEAEKRLARYQRVLEKFGSGKVTDIPNSVTSRLSDDLNTPAAITELDALYRRANGVTDGPSASEADAIESNTEAADKLRASLEFLGISMSANTRGAVNELFENDISKLIASRTAARARKDFKESDRIRDELAAMGVVLKDGKDASGNPTTTWEIAR